MVNKCIKRCPSLWVVREIQMKDHFMSTDLATLKRAIKLMPMEIRDKVSLVHCGTEKLYSFFRR